MVERDGRGRRAGPRAGRAPRRPGAIRRTRDPHGEADGADGGGAGAALPAPPLPGDGGRVGAGRDALHLRRARRRPRPGPRGPPRRAAARARRPGARHSAGRADHPRIGAGRPSAPPVRVRWVARTLPALHGSHVRRDLAGCGRRGPRRGRRVEWEPRGAVAGAAHARSFTARAGRRDGGAHRGGRAERGGLPLRGGGAARGREGCGRRTDGSGGGRLDAAGARRRRPAPRAHEVHGRRTGPGRRRGRRPLRPPGAGHPALRGPALRLMDARHRPAGASRGADRVTRAGVDR